MIARVIPFAAIASWNAFASSGGIGFVFRSMRGLREKSGLRRPRPPCRAPERARCSPQSRRGRRGTSLPRRGNRLNTDELADVRVGPDARDEWRLVYSARYAAASFRAFTTRYESGKWSS